MKILYVTTIGQTMGFFTELIHELIQNGNTVDIATNEHGSPVRGCYREWGCKVYPISCTRSPFNGGTLWAIREIRKIVEQNEYDIVHCHTPIAAMCTRLACRPLRKRGVKVMYTAHGFHFYKGAPLKNWLLYYPMEKMCSYFTDVLITINREDYALALRKMKAKRVAYVPGVGLDIAKFRNTVVDRAEKRKELGVPEGAVVLTSVGELNRNKNHAVVIRALAQTADDRLHYLIAGVGGLSEELRCLAEKLGISHRVHLLGYRMDIAQIYKVSDICVFPSIREGLGLAALEGMAAELPLIASDNRGTRDYSVHEENAMVCRWDSPMEFSKAIMSLATDPAKRAEMGKKNTLIAETFCASRIIAKMKQIYSDLEL